MVLYMFSCWCDTLEHPKAVLSMAPKTDGRPWDGDLFATWQDWARAHQLSPSIPAISK